MGRAGDGSTLSLDFTAMGGTLDPRITFSRADATALATFINSLGYVETVATAQAPRFTFSETSIGTPRGLLLEAPATNLLTYSQDLTQTGWFTSNITVATSSLLSPNNIAYSSGITESATTNTHLLQKGTANTTATLYTLSFWAKSGLRTQLYTSWDGGLCIAKWDLSGSTSPVAAGTNVPTLTQTAYPNGWYKLTATYTAQAGGIYANFYTQNGSGSTYIGTGAFPGNASAVALYIWGVQQETGLGSSYIATTTAAVTRAADTAIIAAGTNFSSWYTGGTLGTFVSNWYGNASSATARSVIATSDQTTKHLHMYQTASALTLRLADFGAAATVTTSNSLTAGALTKGAFSYNGTATSLCLNGGTVATGTLAFSAAPTWLSIGGPSTNGTSITDTTVMINNSIRTIKYFPARLSDGQIQGLTT
jgi:hypothetical protein